MRRNKYSQRHNHGKINHQRVQLVAETIRQHPNQRPAWYAQQLGIGNYAVRRCLVHCEAFGILLAEDDNGRLIHLGSAS